MKKTTGFVLLGAVVAFAGASFAASASISQAKGFPGRWSTKEFGEMKLNQTGSKVLGTYNFKGGRVGGEVTGDRLDGIWAQTSSSHRCDKKQFGSWYWGGFSFFLSKDRNHFTGSWEYCGMRDGSGGAWTGTRIE